ncbi:hypothetical protein [Maritalea mediterranea]|uniref:Uncharacterized protein n=1 Tax=Maritalea mediterranea TaxID=2909667 RepID=A0ABS9E704_9HYPH|nr:hypothetical protein [Maritalea mediterranea]MCF4098612.1 hypothetical protein [Maritalea mediterranea]
MINQQAKLEHASQERENLVEQNAANKEAYQAALEKDRAVSYEIAMGRAAGPTQGLRIGEQNRQGALSIANAQDRKDAARANYVASGHHTTIAANNRIEVERAKANATIIGSFANAFG